MNKLLKYSLITVASLAVLFIGRSLLMKEKPVSEQVKDQTAIIEDVGHEELAQTVEIPHSDLKITPIRSIENEIYLLTAFDMLDEHTLVFAGNFEKKNQVRFFDLDIQKLTIELDLEEMILDIFTHKNTCYVLAEKNIFVVKGNLIVQTIRHEIPAVFTFDRLLELNDQVYVSMSDGTSYAIQESQVLKMEQLELNGNPVWIQKLSPKFFSINLSEEKKVAYSSDLSLGSMTVLGETGGNLICTIEKITGTQPLKVRRVISSSVDNFVSELHSVDMQPFAFLKNDLRLHADKVFQLILKDENVVLTSQNLNK